MAFKEKYDITQIHLSTPSKRRSGTRISGGVKFCVAHDTGNPGSTARNNVAYYERSRDEESASAHLFVDDAQIIECIPALTSAPEKAWHVRYNVPNDNKLFGCDANDAAIGVEYCYGGTIDADEAYKRYVWTLAFICRKFRLDPLTRIVGHCFLDPTRRTDPVTGLLQSRRTYDQLLDDVSRELDECLGKPQRKYRMKTGKGSVRVCYRLNIRKGEPSRRGAVVRVVEPEKRLSYNGWTEEGEKINNIAKWFRNEDGDFFWSGGVV